MIKALKVTMIVYGVIGILLGLVLVFIPDQMGEWFNTPVLNDYEKYLSASIGLANIAAGVFVIMAARNPIKNISWVKFAIVWALFWVVTVVYGLVSGYVDFSQEGSALIINAIFAALFFAFYPWRGQTTS
jgi:uncharacterized membrane protein HdeD (DUF308 family)